MGTIEEEIKKSISYFQSGYEDKYDEVINYHEVMDLKKVLIKIPEFIEYMSNHSKEKYPLAIGYLEQEGLLDDISYARVDSGWIGTLQHSIELLVKSKKDMSLQGFYFGLYETPKEADSTTYHGYYFRPKGNIRRKVYFSNCLFNLNISTFKLFIVSNTF